MPALQAQRSPVIPQPLHYSEKGGHFLLDRTTTIFANSDVINEARILARLIRTATGYPVKIRAAGTTPTKKGIHLLTEKGFRPATKGAYRLEVAERTITARAADATGVFYAIQSLRQLLDVAIESPVAVKKANWPVPAVLIEDAPRFQWRGYMQDVSRTFYSVEVIKKYLDLMALYKMNTFHFHLTDDQGWRVEIKKYPELTSKKTTVFGESSRQPDYRNGYYTQEQIKDIVAYASARHITVVPEIDVPGHCWPIVITHPELATNTNLHPDYVISFMDSYHYWGFQYTPNPLDPTKEAVYGFLDDVFTELAQLFPGKYIHFGGDEVRHEFWEKPAAIREFMKEQNMNSVTDLQNYFVSRVSKIIEEKGKTPIGWNDILAHKAEKLPKNTVIMSWIGSEAVREAARYGFPVIATPAGPLYFDISQDDVNDGTMVDWNYGGGDGKNGKGNTLRKVYAYDPGAGLTPSQQQLLLGVQANMWTAVPQEVKDMNVQNFPRLLAVAEIGWTMPGRKNYEDFLGRLDRHYPRLDRLKVDYFKKGGYIVNTWTPSGLSTDFKTRSWDVTDQVYASGSAQAGFLYTSGSSFLKVKNVKLLENGRPVAEDLHESLADKFRGTPFKKNMFFYILELKTYRPEARYELQAEIAGMESTDSYGNITFSLSPYRPFSAVPTDK
ncbi:hypothetical protein GCM10027051_01950 [Niabella terrae]